MTASNLPLGVCQRIEQRWSAQLKRLQEERDLKAKAASPDLVDDHEREHLLDRTAAASVTSER